MKSENIYRLLVINEFSSTPKYLQLINAILKSIEDGEITQGYVLPSINDLSYELDVSRDTGVKVYKRLKNMGIVNSIPGKGYFIANTIFEKRIRIFLLFNKLSTHKKIIYDSFVAALGNAAEIDFYIYNNDFLLFKELISKRMGNYSYYVIIPHFIEGGENACEVINAIPKEKLILLDKLLPGVSGNYGAVFENFEKDLYNALLEARDKLMKYHTINIIFPKHTYHPKEIVTGFSNFCYDYAFNQKVISDLKKEEIKKGEVYISLMEDDLVSLIEKILAAGYKIGEEAGVLSYNETAIKKIILNGITTISTDFVMIGEKAAKMILEGSTEHFAVPFHLTFRNSL